MKAPDYIKIETGKWWDHGTKSIDQVKPEDDIFVSFGLKRSRMHSYKLEHRETGGSVLILKRVHSE